MLEIENYVKLFVINTLLFFGLSSGVLADSVIINEVYYDPVATESGGEAVVLYNPTPEDIILSGYVLKTESAAQDVILPNNAVIKAKHYFLITDSGWNISRDNVSWDIADYEETMNMFNLDSGVALVDPFGVAVDAVGWGDKVGITAGLYEGDPHTGTGSGFSLSRINNQDTNHNFNDFVSTIPQLHNSSYVLTDTLPSDPMNESGDGTQANNSDQNSNLSLNTTLSIVVTVDNSAPVIDAVTFDDDNQLEAGSQITPLSGANRSVAVHVTLHDANGVDDIAGVDLEVVNTTEKVLLVKNTTLDSTKVIYSGFFTMPYYELPGVYSIKFVSYDLVSSATSMSEFTYLQLGAFNLDGNSLTIKGVVNTTVALEGDSDINTLNKPTISNLGNVKLSLGLLSTDLISSNSILMAQQLGYSFGQTVQQGTLNTSLVLTGASLGPKSLLPFNLYATIPEVIGLGDYAGNITVYGIPSD